ncbi:MAG: hypothetical protein BA873_12625 [Desulfobulbaceae bacterium C00003063]|nr:MAG: hypothetical protein BA873_12625 [Desulfobulbaceae bacterium C00003063]
MLRISRGRHRSLVLPIFLRSKKLAQSAGADHDDVDVDAAIPILEQTLIEADSARQFSLTIMKKFHKRGEG